MRLCNPMYNISSDRGGLYHGTRYLFSRFGIYHGERNHTALGLRPSQTYRTQKYK